MNNKYLKLILVGLSIVVVILSGLYYKQSIAYKDLLMQLTDASQLKAVTLVNEGKVEAKSHLVEEGEIWLALDVFSKYIDADYTLSNSQQRIFLKAEHLQANTSYGGIDAFIKENLKSINVPLRYVEGKPFIELSAIEKLYPLRINYNESLDLLYLVTEDQTIETGTLLEKTPYYIKLNDIYYKVGVLPKGESLTLLEAHESYTMVVDKKGQKLFIPTEASVSRKKLDLSKKELSYTPSKPLDYVGLAWDIVGNYQGNLLKENFALKEGINVISPTWFKLNVQGIVINEASMAYVKKAQSEGLQIWALSDNSFNQQWTHELLQNKTYQKEWLAQTLLYMGIYDLEGINIDFENVLLEDQGALTEFLKMAQPLFKEAGKILSVDVTRPGGSANYSLFIDRRAVVPYVDYMMLMAYDEHWASSPKSGSVASYEWTKASIEMSLKEIPKEKLILGMPLYMRDWVANSQHEARQSKAITMGQLDQHIANKEIKKQYDVTTKQDYYVYYDQGIRHEIWVENIESLKWRMDLLQFYDLAGLAVWSKSFATEEVWETLQQVHK